MKDKKEAERESEMYAKGRKDQKIIREREERYKKKEKQ